MSPREAYDWNEYNLNPLTSNDWRASLVPAAAKTLYGIRGESVALKVMLVTIPPSRVRCDTIKLREVPYSLNYQVEGWKHFRWPG